MYDFAGLGTEESINELEGLLEKELKGLDVSILANNVGVTKFAPYTEVSWEEHIK